MGPEPIRWLHISDLHMGCRGKEVWWRVRSEFKESIREHFQPIDLILVTGDLTFAAQPEQFDQFDRFLDELLGWLRQTGQKADPLVIPVPGNHDLVHLDEVEDVAPFYILENFWKDPYHRSLDSLRKKLWETRSASYFDPLFGNYTSWLERSILPRLTSRRDVSVRRSHFPGDLSVFVDLLDRPPLTVVGLNSAWVQYTKGDFEEKIELFTQQLDFALGDGNYSSPLDALDKRQNLLLMHHPPAWLSRKSRQSFDEEIYPPDRFLLCLHGHMHEGRSEVIYRSTEKFRYFFQAPSLFGLEHYGTASESRAIGYAWGSMDPAGTVRVWPLKRDRQGGRQVFMWDMEFLPDQAGHRIRPLTDVLPTAPIVTVDAETIATRDADSSDTHANSLWERDQPNDLPDYFRVIFPEIKTIFEGVVLHYLCLQRAQTAHLKKRRHARTRLQVYAILSGLIGSITSLIGAAQYIDSKIALNFIQHLGPLRYTGEYTLFILGLIMASVGIAQKIEPYLKNTKSTSTDISSNLDRLNDLKSDIVHYDPRRDRDDIRLRSLESTLEVIRTDLNELYIFSFLPFNELTQREKQQALEFKSAWYLRIKKRDAMAWASVKESITRLIHEVG